jgi:hypothetical protein
MTFRVHALHVRIVVTALQAVRRRLCRTGARQAARSEAGSGAHSGTVTAVDGSTQCGTQKRAHCCAFRAGILSDRIGGRAAHLLMGELTARAIIEAELIEILAGARQCHHAGPCRDSDASGQREQSGDQGKLEDALHKRSRTRWLRSDALPRTRAALDIRVIRLRVGAVIPRRRFRRGSRRTLLIRTLDIHWRIRSRDHSRWVVRIVRRIIVRAIAPCEHWCTDEYAHMPTMVVRTTVMKTSTSRRRGTGDAYTQQQCGREKHTVMQFHGKPHKRSTPIDIVTKSLSFVTYKL